jgi:hypothetical protein
MPDRETGLVMEYGSMKTLKKLGISLDAKDLTDLEVEFFCIIDDEIARINKEELNKSRKR